MMAVFTQRPSRTDTTRAKDVGEMISFFGYDLAEDKASPSSSVPEMLEVFQLLKPEPSAHPFIRIGANLDGSYLVPDDFKGISACFSPGVNNFKNFEDFLVETYGINCHMCDFSSDLRRFKTPLKEGKQSFLKKWLDVKTGGDSISLDDWVKEKSPTGDLLLQMDIEGAEYRNLLSVSDETLSRFRIIVLEVHDLSQIANAAIRRNVIAPFFKRLSTFFTNIHAHPNNCQGEFTIPGTNIGIPNVLELTYIRKDRLGAARYAPLLPHPLDVSRNVPRRPPLFLGEEWLGNGRPLESKVKMLEDRLDYQISSAQAQAANALTTEHGELILRSLQTLSGWTEALVSQSADRKSRLHDVAIGRPYVLSSAYAGTNKTGVVREDGAYFFHTGIGKNQFVSIDLGETFNIGKISVTNRRDACFDRPRALFAMLSTRPEVGQGDVFWIPTTKEFLSGKKSYCEVSIPATRARFVTLTSPLETALHLANIEVFAFD